MVDRHELMLGNTFVAQKNMQPPKKEIPPQVDMLTLSYVLVIIRTKSCLIFV